MENVRPNSSAHVCTVKDDDSQTANADKQQMAAAQNSDALRLQEIHQALKSCAVSGPIFSTREGFPRTPAAGGTGESAGYGQDSEGAKTGAAENKPKAERPPEGTRVRIIKAKPGSKQERHLGCEGTVTCHAQRNRLDVKLANLNPKVGVPVFMLFEVDEVEVIE